jgi:hypothetical protein
VCGRSPAVVTGASSARTVHRVAVGRSPAVAVVGLRRSGRTGNGESIPGRIAPARRDDPQFTPDAGARSRARG